MPGFTPTLTPLLQGLGLVSPTPAGPPTPTIADLPVLPVLPVTPKLSPEASPTVGYDPKEITRMSDPKTFGPGQWQGIHIYASHATTDELKRAFMEYMQIIADNLKCDKCRQHAMDYLAKNPMKDYLNIKNADGVDIGMLKWTWIFHNSVNSRLGKPLMDWETCYAMYGDKTAGVCQKDCGDSVTIGVTASTRQPEPITVKTFLNGKVVYAPRKFSPNLKMAPKNI